MPRYSVPLRARVKVPISSAYEQPSWKFKTSLPSGWDVDYIDKRDESKPNIIFLVKGEVLEADFERVLEFLEQDGAF